MGKAAKQMAISLRLLSLCLVLLVGGVLGEALEIFEERSTDCTAEVLKATSSCQASNSQKSSMAQDVCGTTTYTTTMTKVTHMKELATQQGELISHSVTVLANAKSQAAVIAKAAGVERTVLLSKLADQKTSKDGVAKLKDDETRSGSDMETLKDQADRATEEAVEIARTTDDPATVEAAKKKACDLRSKYLDLELHLATLHRSVHTAKHALAKVSGIVEKEIVRAKATGEKEATALKTIAKDKQDLAENQKQQAEVEVEANAKASRAAQAAEHTLKIRADKASKDIAAAKANVEQVKRLAAKAKSDEQDQKTKKPSVDKIDMKKLEGEAKVEARDMILDVKHNNDQGAKQSKQSKQSKQDAQTAVIKATASKIAHKDAKVASAVAAHDSSSASKTHREGMTMEHRAHQAVALARGETLHPKFRAKQLNQANHVVQAAAQHREANNDHMTAGGQTSSHHSGNEFVIHPQHHHSNSFGITHESTKTGSIVHVQHSKQRSNSKPRAKHSKPRATHSKTKVVQVQTVGAPKDIHDRYAHKVRLIETQRLQAADSHKEAKQNLDQLMASHASPAKVAQAKADVNAAAKTMQNLLKAQTEAVAEVVKHIQNREPEYTDKRHKTPTDSATPNDSNEFEKLGPKKTP